MKLWVRSVGDCCPFTVDSCLQVQLNDWFVKHKQEILLFVFGLRMASRVEGCGCWLVVGKIFGISQVLLQGERVKFHLLWKHTISLRSSQIVRNTLTRFGQIQLTKVEKYLNISISPLTRS